MSFLAIRRKGFAVWPRSRQQHNYTERVCAEQLAVFRALLRLNAAEHEVQRQMHAERRRSQ